MRLLCLLLLLPLTVNATPLDEALMLVREHHPVLVAERAQLEEQGRQRDWTARVSMSWTERGTEFGGEGGANAGLRLNIPLFDRKQKLERSRARAGFAEQRAKIEAAFLGEVKSLSRQASDVSAAQQLRDLYRDRLAYRKQQVDEGLEEADVLWSEAEAMQKAEQSVSKSRRELEAGLETTAREYGGYEWKRLQALLAAHVKQN